MIKIVLNSVLRCVIAAYFARSKRSSSITFAQADANARTKSPEASVDAWTSASDRNCAWDPKTRSTIVAVLH